MSTPATLTDTPLRTIIRMMRQVLGLQDLAVAVGATSATVRNWDTPDPKPHLRLAVRLHLLYRIVSELVIVLPDDEVRSWLKRNNCWLDGAKPIDKIAGHVGPLPPESDDRVLLAARHLLRSANLSEHIAATLPIDRIAAGILQHLVASRASQILICSPQSLRHWATGTKPGIRSQERLRRLARVICILELDGNPQAIQPWLMHHNPALDQERPRKLLADGTIGDYERVLAAAYAFVTLP
jgi:uncharacterized protein (DUF2384 family)